MHACTQTHTFMYIPTATYNDGMTCGFHQQALSPPCGNGTATDPAPTFRITHTTHKATSEAAFPPYSLVCTSIFPFIKQNMWTTLCVEFLPICMLVCGCLRLGVCLSMHVCFCMHAHTLSHVVRQVYLQVAIFRCALLNRMYPASLDTLLHILLLGLGHMDKI